LRIQRYTKSPDHVRTSEIPEPTDADSARAADLLDAQMRQPGWIVREIGVREHRSDGGEACGLAPDWPSECEVAVERTAEHSQPDAVATLYWNGGEYG
jgi:hypothetical protein